MTPIGNVTIDTELQNKERNMPYDVALSERVKEILSTAQPWREQRMMGGVVYMVNGNLCCGVDHSDLIVRVGAGAYDAALKEPHVRPMQISGRALKGFVLVAKRGYSPPRALRKWVIRGVDFALSLPARSGKAKKPGKRAVAKLPRVKRAQSSV